MDVAVNLEFNNKPALSIPREIMRKYELLRNTKRHAVKIKTTFVV